MEQDSLHKTQNLLSHLNKEEGVYFAGKEIKIGAFESAYIESRTKENRVLRDETVKELPQIKSGPHQTEWELRAKSAARVYKYFSDKKDSNLLDLGCGNGWFASGLAQNPSLKVLGLDMNLIELQQAVRVFKRNNLYFIYGDIFSLPIAKETFQYITIVASIQYFKNLDKLFKCLMDLLTDKGEIHIIDSPFYYSSSIKKAKERTNNYYRQSGQKEMIDYYQHHSFDDLVNWNYRFLYNPKKINFINKIFKKKDMPFPWIKIVKE